MEWDSSDDGLDAFMSSQESEFPELTPTTSKISENEFSCHCCYDILVNPTTLTCGHNFCRHCLALWWESSHKNECPECREKWEGFPKINILLRCAFHCLMWLHYSHFSNMQKTQYKCRFGYFAMHKNTFCFVALISRDATNKLFSDIVQQRRTEIQASPKISRSLLAFQR